MIFLFKKIICIILLIIILIPFCQANAVSAHCFVLYDPLTKDILLQRNMNKIVSMASTTKIMTGLIVCELGNLDEIVTITKNMITVEGSSIGLQVNDKISKLNLLYGLMLESGNDAANTLAIATAGSLKEFAKLMNDKAREIGMKNTSFVTPSGLDDKNHYTTAYDMALLAAYAMKNETFGKVVSTKKYISIYNDNDTRRTYYNHNRLLSSCEGVEGIKTGFTKKSGRCLVTSCTRNGSRLIAVTLNAPSDWNDHKELYNYGFSQYETVSLGGNFDISTVLVAGGTKTKIKLRNLPVEVNLHKDIINKITYEIEMPVFIYAPVSIGDIIGQVKFLYKDNVIASSPFTAAQSSDIIEVNSENILSQIINWIFILMGIM